MCGIFAAFNIKGEYSRVRAIIVKMLKRIIHRGPDSTGITSYSENDKTEHHFICHQRLAIVDQSSQGEQPFFSDDGNICGVGNGEIYNHLKVIYNLLIYKFIVSKKNNPNKF
jgi:asparagine synthase (glutamine-hydrolysing)